MVSVAAGSQAMSAGVEAQWRVQGVAGEAVDADGETFAASLQACGQARDPHPRDVPLAPMPGSNV